jgi:YVTN family beta-propeller protein
MVLIIPLNAFGQEQYAYVANSSSGTITVVDLSDHSTQNLNIGQNPNYIKKAPGIDQLWVSDPGYYQVKVLNSSTGAVLFTENLTYSKELVISPDGLLAYVAYEDYPVQLKVYNTTDLTQAYNYSLSAINNMDDIALSPAGDVLYILYNSYFYFVNPVNGVITNTINLSYYAERILISPDGKYAYAYGDYSYIQKIDLQSSVVTSQYIGSEAYSLAISPDGQYLYAGFYSNTSVNVYDAGTLNQVSTISVGSSRVMDLHVSSDGNLLYVLHRDNPNFEIYDIQSGTQQASVSTGSYSFRFDFDLSTDSIPPQPVTNLQAPEIYHDAALLTWTAASDDSLTEPVRGYEVRYDTVAITNIDSARVYDHSLKPSDPGEADSLLLTGLTPGTNYWIAVRTYDEARNFSEPAFLELSTLMPPEITLSPEVLEFTVSIGDTATETITITNSAGSGAGLLDYSIRVTGEDEIEQLAYVANQGSGTVSVIDFVNETVENYYVGNSPFEIAQCPLSNEIWITDGNDNLKVLDASTGAINMQMPLYDLRKVLTSPDGTLAYVVYERYPVQVKVYNTESLTEINNFSISGSSYADDASLSPDGQTLYMVDGNDFYALDVSSGSTINTIYLNENSYRIVLSPDGLYAYLFGSYYLQRIDLQNYGQTLSYIGDEIYSLTVSSDGQKLYASFYYGYSITVYDSQTLTQTSSISLSNSSRITDLKVSSSGKLLYVLHRYSPNLVIYDLQSGSEQAMYTTGSSSYRFALSGSSFPFVELNPKSGKVSGGQSAQISLVIDAANLFHRTYAGNLVVESNDPGNPSTAIPFTITALDTKGPDFNLAFFINPYLSSYLRVMIFVYEYLPELPELIIDNTTPIPLVIQDSLHHIYMGKHKLSQSGNIVFTVSGNDSLGNTASFEKTLSVEQVLFAKPALAAYGEEQVFVQFPAYSFENDRFVIVWEEEMSSKTGKQGVEKAYHIAPEQLLLKERAVLTIAYPERNGEDFNPLHYSIYRKNSGGQWEKLPSRVNKDENFVVAEIDQLGIFRVGYDPSSVSEEIIPIPAEYGLSQNYPNPFNPTTTIYYTLPNAEKVTLKVYDVLGRAVSTLVNEPQQAGEYWIHFDARELTSGLYFYRLEAGSFTETKKMIVLK